MNATVEIAQLQNGKLTRLYLGNLVIWFSYETPVAYSIPGTSGVVVSDKEWSQTTRRHINSIPGRRAPIAHEEFEAGLAEATERLNAALEDAERVSKAAESAQGTSGTKEPSTGLVIALDSLAEALYADEAPASTFATLFSRSELEILAGLCQITADLPGRSYDDEVFDALAMLS